MSNPKNTIDADSAMVASKLKAHAAARSAAENALENFWFCPLGAERQTSLLTAVLNTRDSSNRRALNREVAAILDAIASPYDPTPAREKKKANLVPWLQMLDLMPPDDQLTDRANPTKDPSYEPFEDLIQILEGAAEAAYKNSLSIGRHQITHGF